jgi:hypothetical protein
MVYTTTIDNLTIKFKCPSRALLTDLASYSENKVYEYYEELIKSCVLFPTIVFSDVVGKEEGVIYITPSSNTMPGFIVNLGKEIIKKTGFFDKSELDIQLKKAELYIESPNGSYDALCLAVIPGLKPTDLWEMEPHELYRTYMLAYKIAPAIGIDPRMFTDISSYNKTQEDIRTQQKLAQGQQEANARVTASMGRGKNISVESADTQTFRVG